MKILQKMTALLSVLLFSISAFSAIDALNFDNAKQEQDYHSLTQELRCPQCQNNNIADSNATIAVDMRGKVLELLKEGKSKDDVVNYMVERYGNFVTYNPPMTAGTLILWIAPIALIIFGLVIVFRRKRSSTNVAQIAKTEKRAVENHEISDQLTAEQQQRLNEILHKGQQ
ncbi:cytochrome c-type biogenesis protein CcmH [Cricetibacter osteomyelitidis]|uniref:Cytochrome c-type biogenesis protein n=1 Tax=Cricetibacter osteomyelitidis TaxID=1521931 RepID=A0A4V2T0W4_9PAST|nr:cytochrome c-type biogenesis protein [Cricetibacter osteomyelitidis]TCP91273.1 cytochrome c-type biogenesis protein CcmH [Cricetibacter osteomyelitidis]